MTQMIDCESWVDVVSDPLLRINVAGKKTCELSNQFLRPINMRTKGMDKQPLERDGGCSRSMNGYCVGGGLDSKNDGGFSKNVVRHEVVQLSHRPKVWQVYSRRGGKGNALS